MAGTERKPLLSFAGLSKKNEKEMETCSSPVSRLTGQPLASSVQQPRLPFAFGEQKLLRASALEEESRPRRRREQFSSMLFCIRARAGLVFRTRAADCEDVSTRQIVGRTRNNNQARARQSFRFRQKWNYK